jgi:hypothetical protein
MQGPRFQTAHALIEVRDPARLAHLSVVDDIDSRLNLAANHLGDGVTQTLRVRFLVNRFTALLGDEERQQLLRAG